MISDALGPLMTFARDTSVLRILGTSPVNKFLQLLRSSIIHRKKYQMLADMAKHAMEEVIRMIPPHWGNWASCIRKFRAHTHFDRNGLIATANILQTPEIVTPRGLAAAPKPRIEATARTNDKAAQPPRTMAGGAMLRGR